MAYHFSERTKWPLGENHLSQVIEQRRVERLEVLDLTESNPTRCGFDYPAPTILAPLASSASLQYAPESAGLLKTRQAVCGYYDRKGVTLSPEQILLASSTSEGYTWLFRLLAEPGDKILVPAPSYPLFSFLADINDVVVEHYYLRLEGDCWRINFESIEQAIDEKTRAIILVSPNNPTGSFIKKDELAQLNRLCAAHGMAIICDEVFADYVFSPHDQDYVSLAGNAQALTFVLGGLSKALALPQMKMAWLVANGPQETLTAALARLEIIADTYLSVNTPVQHAAVAWLEQPAFIRDQVMARVTGNLKFLKGSVLGLEHIQMLPVEGGWYALLKVADLCIDEEWAIGLLQRKGVLVHPGFFFDMASEDYVVLSLLPRPEIFEDGVRRIVQSLSTR